MRARLLYSTTATAMAMTVQQRTFLCKDGVQLAAQHYSRDPTDTATKFLLLHGWLDNCRSFHKLAPKLPGQVIALDLPGHGLSTHKSKDGTTAVLAEGIYYVHEVLQELGWDAGDVTLIGHSMGAAISLIYAAAFPENVANLVLLEGAGPVARDGKESLLKGLRGHVERRYKGNAESKQPRVYPSLELAVETRMKTASYAPGKQYISKEAAYELVKYATKEVDGGIQFLHDSRLHYPSLLSMTSDQVLGVQQSVSCSVCLLLAEDGWPMDEDKKRQVLETIQPKHCEVLPGSHHFHADPDTADKVAEKILDFLGFE